MLVRNTAIYGVTRGAAGLVNFLAVVIYSRLLAPAEYGRYALLIATVGVAGAGLFQWLRSGARRFLAAHQDRREAFVATLVRGYLMVLGVAVIIAVVALVAGRSQSLSLLIMMGLLIFAAQGWYDLTLELLLVDLEPFRYGLISLTRSCIGVGVASGMALAGFGAPGVLLGVLSGYALPPLFLARRTWGNIQPQRASPEIRQELLRYGLPLTATFALELVVSSSDRFLLGALAGLEEVGRYAVSYDIGYQAVTTLFMIVNLAAFPLTVRAVELHGRVGADAHLRKHGTVLMLVAAPAVIGLIVLAPNIARVLIGAEFRSAAGMVLPAVSLAALLAGLKAYYFDLSYQLGRATGIQVWVSGAAALVNLGLNLIWIPRWGAAGAAYATLVAYAAGCGLSWALGSRGIRLPVPWLDWGRIAVAAGLMGLSLMPVMHWRGAIALGGQVALGVVAYLALVVMFNVAGSRGIAQGLLGRVRPGASA